ncbi:MAG TPA: hypothetical protein VFE58_08615 [Tepidisphaeraceae bacterium]|jgi:demethoxyubiquinone hydroxylase (CLK1/Coq7/Cat5 family)|nr:hypothetical protein [Tepidisphaeraceae bacterium]
MATKKNDAMLKQEINSPLIITTGIISVLLLIVSAVGLEAWFRYEEQAELDEKWTVNTNTWLADIHTQELEHLNSGYHWTDAKKTAVDMPIKDAMEIIARNQGKTR